MERGFALDQSAVTVFAWGAAQMSTPVSPEAAVSAVAEAILASGTAISSMVSPDETVPKVGQVEVAVVVAGRSSIWEGWSKRSSESLCDLSSSGLWPT